MKSPKNARSWLKSWLARFLTLSVLSGFVIVMAFPIPARAKDATAVGPISQKFEHRPGFWVPKKLFIKMEAAFEAEDSLKAELESRKEESKHLEKSNLQLALTASVSIQWAKGNEGRWVKCESDRKAADDDTSKVIVQSGLDQWLWPSLERLIYFGAGAGLVVLTRQK